MKLTQTQINLSLALTKHSICRRAMWMHILLSGYSHFYELYNKKQLIKSKPLTYKDAEYITSKLEKITGTSISPKDIIYNENDIADEILDEYEQLQKAMNSFQETLRPIIDAYYHYLYHCRPLNGQVLQSLLVALAAFLNYVSGVIDKQELKNNIVFFDTWHARTIPIDSATIRHSLIQLEQDFNDICIKRANRSLLQKGQGLCSQFNINITM